MNDHAGGQRADCSILRLAGGVRQAAGAGTYDNTLRDFGVRFIEGYNPPSGMDLVADAGLHRGYAEWAVNQKCTAR